MHDSTLDLCTLALSSSPYVKVWVTLTYEHPWKYAYTYISCVIIVKVQQNNSHKNLKIYQQDYKNDSC